MGSRVNCKSEFGVSKDNTLLAFFRKCIACIVRKSIACSCIARRKIAEGRGPQMAESAYRDRIMSDNLGVQHRLRTMHTACLPARMRMLDVEKLN